MANAWLGRDRFLSVSHCGVFKANVLIDKKMFEGIMKEIFY